MENSSWKAVHVKFKDLEKAAGHTLAAFNDIRNGIPGLEISIRIPYYQYRKYGILKAVSKMGLESHSAIYINF